MRLLLISNSTNASEEYLHYPIQSIGRFLGDVGKVLFLPYAAVTFSYDEYLCKVQKRFDDINVTVRSAHEFSHPAAAVEKAHAIVVGGGNTFALLKKMQDHGLMDPIRKRVREGKVPYIGWSAGSNVACPTIRTTNDMPIVEPGSFEALGLVPFQINPHFTDAKLEGHAGETREQRIEEFLEANHRTWVAGLRESCMLTLEGHELMLSGPHPMRVFRHGQKPKEVTASESLSFLME
ncbi:MAG: dipeptidase PepE [Rikenellaceae bacterium]|jgi:dipeptidase E|nr:dipeptidase PepE [Rikenellaceae bacterium]